MVRNCRTVCDELLHKLFQSATPSKRALGRQANESPSSLKKRKQLSMDDFVSSVCKIIRIVNFGGFK